MWTMFFCLCRSLGQADYLDYVQRTLNSETERVDSIMDQTTMFPLVELLGECARSSFPTSSPVSTVDFLGLCFLLSFQKPNSFPSTPKKSSKLFPPRPCL